MRSAGVAFRTSGGLWIGAVDESRRATEFRVLGPVEAWQDDRPVRLGGRRQRALLALLLLEPGRPVSVDTLTEELWVGTPPPGAAKSLRVYVSRLRAALADGTVVARPPGYALGVDADRIDATRFEGSSEKAATRSGAVRQASRRNGSALRLRSGEVLRSPTSRTRGCLRGGAAPRRASSRCAGGVDRGAAGSRPSRGARRRAGAARCGATAARAALAAARDRALPLRAAGRRAGRIPTRPFTPSRRARARAERRAPRGRACGSSTRGCRRSGRAGAAQPSRPRRRASSVASELAELERLLREQRLVTVTGTGVPARRGLRSKSRHARWRWSNGTWLVDLIPFSDPALVPSAVARIVVSERRRTCRSSTLSSTSSRGGSSC